MKAAVGLMVVPRPERLVRASRECMQKLDDAKDICACLSDKHANTFHGMCLPLRPVALVKESAESNHSR